MNPRLVLCWWLAVVPAWCVDLKPCAAAAREGRFAEAKKLCEKAAEEFAQAKDLRGQSSATNLTGNALLRLGDLEGARQRYRESIALAKQAGDDEAVAGPLNNLGGVDYFQGRYEDAQRHYQEAADWAAARPNAPWSAREALTTAINQAAVLQRLGRDRAALDLYLKLQPQAKRLKAGDEGRMLANIGALYRSLGDPWKARSLYASALERFRAAGSGHGISGVLKNMGIAEAVEFENYPEARRLFAQVLTAAQANGDQREAVLAQLYLAEVALREGKLDDAEWQWKQSLQAAQQSGAPEEQWRALYGLGRVAEARGGDAGQWYGRSIAQVEKLRQLTSRGAARTDFLAGKRDVYDAQIRRLVRQGQVTDELLDTMERSRARMVADQSFRVSRTVLQQQLRPEETLVIYWVAGAEKAAVWVTKTGTGISQLAGGWLEGVPVGKRMILVPDGGIETQPMERGLEAEVTFLPAVRLLAAPPPGRPVSEGMLVAGPGLKNVLREVAEVAGALPAHWTQYQGKAEVLKAMPQAAVIHIGAHAVPDYEREDRSRILLNDGPLLLAEVGKAKLTSDLVTLAACQTGIGRQVRGEGVQSLANAFLTAGARSVVASRHPMDDGATRSFMAQFYAALAQGETKAGALRTAKRRLRESGGPLAKEEFWEPWILFGDGRGTVAEPSRGRWLLWGAAAVAAVCALWIRMRRTAGVA